MVVRQGYLVALLAVHAVKTANAMPETLVQFVEANLMVHVATIPGVAMETLR
jgi:hypothetical protein